MEHYNCTATEKKVKKKCNYSFEIPQLYQYGNKCQV